MPTPKIEDVLIEYNFTAEEYRTARILFPIQVIYFSDLYSKLFKQKASMLMPDSQELNLQYIQKICEMEGRLGMIQQLLDNHKDALKELSDVKKNDPNAGSEDIVSIADRASKLVNVHS